MTNHKTSFWKLLSEQAVCIPIIQRDYAQGRDGMEYLRKKFLQEIKSALKAEDASGFLTLDFVYGAESDTALLPLDGQQRLTTLWLIHWYLAFRLNFLTTENGISEIGETLQRFSYETRISSREFCRQLCTLRQPTEEELKSKSYSLLNFIRSQTWFYTAWNQDPTIQAMLRMLNGTDKKDSKTNEDITDGIAESLSDCDLTELDSYWRKLTSDDQCPVMFYKLTIGSEQLPMTDELYIKMNARGKALTDFENFKADLIDWIYQDEHSELISVDPDTVKEHQAMYASLLDNWWMDIFWDFRTREKNPNRNADEKEDGNVDGKVDEVYFTFLNRYFFNEAVLIAKSTASLQESPIWKLYGDESDDTRIAYTGFELYSVILQSSDKFLPRLKSLFKNLESHQSSINNALPEWVKTKSNTFNFIPVYETDESGKLVTIKNEADRPINKVSPLTQEQRVLFLAVTKYFEKTQFDEIKFSRWMRVASNLIENPRISTIEDMIGRIRLINELSDHIDDLYNFLANDWGKIKSKAASEQLWEEHEKCLKIIKSGCHLPDTSNYDAEYWATAIIEMENFAFFNGSIRFLFMNEEGSVDWSFFPTKAKYATLIFNEKGLTPDYCEEAKANRIIISYCNDWNAQIESWTRNNKYIFSYDSDTWRNNILLKRGNRDYSLLYDFSIHKLLTGNNINYPAVIDTDAKRQIAFNRLVITNVIDKVLRWKKTDRFYVRDIYDNLCLYPSSEGVILTLPNRDNVLSELLLRNIISLDWNRALNTENSPMFIGWEIFFYYNDNAEIYQFQWSHWNTIYMCKDFKRLIDCDAKYTQKYFSIDGNLTCEEIIASMNSCILRYQDIETNNQNH